MKLFPQDDRVAKKLFLFFWWKLKYDINFFTPNMFIYDINKKVIKKKKKNYKFWSVSNRSNKEFVCKYIYRITFLSNVLNKRFR